MSRSLCFLGFLLFATASRSASAQGTGTSQWADSTIRLIEQALASGQPADFDQAVALADRALTVNPGDGVLLHYKGYALYRKASFMSGSGARSRSIKLVLEEADAVLEQSAAVLKWPETYAVRATVLGQIIGVSGMMAAMRLGPRSDHLFEQAMKLDEGNPRVWMLRGIGSIYKPRMFGGGNDKAERDLKKAIELFAADHPATPAPSWGHAESWAWLGQVYAREKKVDDARAAYQQALALQPDYGWVTNDLLPALASIKR